MLKPEEVKLIDKLEQGACTPAEIDYLFQLVKKLPESEASILMGALWQYSGSYPALEDTLSTRIYQKVLSQIMEDKTAGAPEKITVVGRKSLKGQRLVVWSAAAALLLMVSLATWLWISKYRFTVISTAFAEQQTLDLPDGSVVTLNANSTLKFHDNWNDSETRKVWLEGEAFFEVQPKLEKGQKFQVITADLVVEVKGTVFNVNTRQDQTSVYLEEGKVALRLKHQSATKKIMKPGDLLRYSAKKKAILADIKMASSEMETSWKNGVLVFEETPLEEVLIKLEDIYGVTFQCQDPRDKDRKITTGLPVEKLELVISMLENTLGLKIRKVGGKYILAE